MPLILMRYRATPQASTGVTRNMMMLDRPPLGPAEEEQTVSEYVATLQDRLRAAYCHAREGLQRAALHQKHDYNGKVQRREYQAGELVWVHDITLGQNRGTKLQFPWYGPVLIMKVLNRGRVVIRRKQGKPFTVIDMDRLKARQGRAGMDGSRAAWMCRC